MMPPLDKTRNHLVHVLPDLQVNGCYAMILSLVSELKSYSHTLLTECSLSDVDRALIITMQTAGVDVKIVPKIGQVHLDEYYTGAILYNVQERLTEASQPIPIIYYSYGIHDANVKRDATLVCSDYAHHVSRYEEYRQFPECTIVPPMVQTRALRRLKAPEHLFTIGVLTSGAYDKYPCNFVRELMYKLPDDVAVLINTLPRYKHPGVLVALQERFDRCKGQVGYCPIGPTKALHCIARSDIVVYASTEKHNEPYGRLVVEAMAMGKPVVCENKGVFKESLHHGRDSLLFETVDQAVEHISTIRSNKSIASQLGSNAQLQASWQDTAVHIGKLTKVLRSIGA